MILIISQKLIFAGFNKLLESAITGVSSGTALTLVSGHSKGRRPPKRHFDEADRFFSLSSVTSPVSLSLNLNTVENLVTEPSQNGLQQKIIFKYFSSFFYFLYELSPRNLANVLPNFQSIFIFFI